MLFIALILALLFYVALYFVWVAMSPHLERPASTLVMLRDMLFTLPPFGPLAVLKWAIIILAIYLVADALIASTRRTRSRKAESRNQQPVTTRHTGDGIEQ